MPCVPRPVKEIRAAANHIPRLIKRAVDTFKANGVDIVHLDGELTGFGVRVSQDFTEPRYGSVVVLSPRTLLDRMT